MGQIAQRYRRLAEEFTRRVAAVTDEQWSWMTPCAGWTVSDVLRHVIGNNTGAAGRVGLTVAGDASPEDEPLRAWQQSRDGMQALLDDPECALLEHDGYNGRTTLQETVDQFVSFDLLVHGWDIARATGQDETLPVDEVRTVHQAALGMGEMLRMDGVCGPEVPVPADASEQDKLLGLLGRTP